MTGIEGQSEYFKGRQDLKKEIEDAAGVPLEEVMYILRIIGNLNKLRYESANKQKLDETQ